jgi:hypothetical protein
MYYPLSVQPVCYRVINLYVTGTTTCLLQGPLSVCYSDHNPSVTYVYPSLSVTLIWTTTYMLQGPQLVWPVCYRDHFLSLYRDYNLSNPYVTNTTTCLLQAMPGLLQILKLVCNGDHNQSVTETTTCLLQGPLSVWSVLDLRHGSLRLVDEQGAKHFLLHHLPASGLSL